MLDMFEAILITTILFLPATILSEMIHELGHYVVLRLLGEIPICIEIGSGRIWFTFHLGKNLFRVKKGFLSGAAVVVAKKSTERLVKWQQVAFFAAGSCFQITFSAAIVALSMWKLDWLLLQITMSALGVVIMYGAIKQLIPDKAKSNDGSLILLVLSSRKSKHE